MNKTTVLIAGLLSAGMVFGQGPGGPGRMGGPGGRMMGMMGGMPGMQTVVTAAPYSATRTTAIQETLQGGNQINRTQSAKVYRDSQGRVREEHTFTPPASSGQPARTNITIFDPVAGFVYMLNPANKTARKMAIPANRGTQRQPGTGAAAGANSQTADLGTKTVNGVLATGKQVTITIPAGAIGNQQAIQIVREVWTSTDLKVPVEVKSSDPRFGTTTMELTGITQSEPDSSLFVVPADYTVTTGPAGGRGGMMRQPRQRQ